MGCVSKNSFLARWEGRSGLLEVEEKKIYRAGKEGDRGPLGGHNAEKQQVLKVKRRHAPAWAGRRAHGAATRHPALHFCSSCPRRTRERSCHEEPAQEDWIAPGLWRRVRAGLKDQHLRSKCDSAEK